MTRSYTSALREQQAELTRGRIVEATWELLRTTRPVDLSYKDVAKEAGVSKRTVYRHFPTPDDLFAAVASRVTDQLLQDMDLSTASIAQAVALNQRQFAMMEEDPAVFRAFFALPIDSRAGGRGFVERLFGADLAHLDADHRRVALGLIDLLASPYAWDVLHARWGADARTASRAAVVGIRALLDHLAAHPDHLDPDGPSLVGEEEP